MRAPILLSGEKDLPAPQQERSIQKRLRLQAAARRVFANHGYAAASVEEITRRAGVAVGAFYVYFRSKRHVLVDLMNELLQRLQAMKLEIPPGTDIQSALRVFLREAMKADRDNYGVIKAWNEAAATDPLLAKQEKTIKQWTEARIRGVCEEVIRRRRAGRPRDLNVFARIIDRHLWMLLGRAPDMTKREFDIEVRVTADLIFRYLSGA